MAKKHGFQPYVMLTGGISDGGDVSVIGGGTGEGMSDPFPMSYTDWMKSGMQDDYNVDGTIDFDDYGTWWADNGFSMEAWASYNPGVDWNPDWEG